MNDRRGMIFSGAILLAVLVMPMNIGRTAEPSETPASNHPGYRLLRTKAFLPADFDDEVFEALWKTWPEPLRTRAAEANPQQRRSMLFAHYGLMPSPDQLGGGHALGYVNDGRSGWVMNCFTCHGGKVAGRVILGLPNTHLALQTLTEDVRTTKLALQKTLTHMDVGSLAMPLGTTIGTTNAVMFGVALEALRDADLNLRLTNPRPKMQHHDMDAPVWWHLHKKKWIYADGGVAKSHRALMQFMLVPQNDAETFKGWEEDFKQISDWIETLRPPKYPFAIDRALAQTGREVFKRTCAKCHGTYGENWTYPNKIVPIAKVGTDPVRMKSLSAQYRRAYGKSWLTGYDRNKVNETPGGYVAPPLDGIWATAPYFHNGSVPTLWHVLHPDERPVVWRRTEDGYDRERIGLEVSEFNERPSTAKSPRKQRHYFDTRPHGKSAAGHRFPDELTKVERRAVLEYLKGL